MTEKQKKFLLDLADEIEAATVPVPKDLVLLRDERAAIIECLRIVATQQQTRES